jgi:hypothetical protein
VSRRNLAVSDNDVDSCDRQGVTKTWLSNLQ